MNALLKNGGLLAFVLLALTQGASTSPDGHTLLLTSTTLTIVPSAYKKLSFDLLTDLAPIRMLSACSSLTKHAQPI